MAPKSRKEIIPCGGQTRSGPNGTLNTNTDGASLQPGEFQTTDNFIFRKDRAKRREGSSLVFDFAFDGVIQTIDQQQFRDETTPKTVIGTKVGGATNIETVQEDTLVMYLSLDTGQTNLGIVKGYGTDPSIITLKQTVAIFNHPQRLTRSFNGDLFVGLDGASGGYVSTDYGESWTITTTTPSTNNAERVPNSIYFLGNGVIGGSWGVMRSDNGGHTFATLVLSIGAGPFEGFVKAFSDTLILLFYRNSSTTEIQIQSSTASPYTAWSGAINVTTSSDSNPLDAIQLKHDATNFDRIVLVGTTDSGSSGWYSDDSGATWTQATGVTSDLYAVIEDQNGDIYAVGTNTSTDTVFKSTDGGATYSAINDDITGDPDFMAIAIGRTGSFYALNGDTGAACHLWKSTDSGVTWTKQNATSYGLNNGSADGRHGIFVV